MFRAARYPHRRQVWFHVDKDAVAQVQDDPALKKSLEAKLQALQTEHHEHAQAALEQKLAKRYHKASPRLLFGASEVFVGGSV